MVWNVFVCHWCCHNTSQSVCNWQVFQVSMCVRLQPARMEQVTLLHSMNYKYQKRPNLPGTNGLAYYAAAAVMKIKKFHKNDARGLNFTSPIDAKQFRECCVSFFYSDKMFFFYILVLLFTVLQSRDGQDWKHRQCLSRKLSCQFF